ncbi:hypothetical protein GRI43_04725 [Altererythrobacter luteolus]|uniref:Uncharacterized protein n=1 Tax=Pontixanthobacter luteolus TaxID=295089 RepID=A0A6I4UXP7_9SPHN|nr:hypothetical protein [Pontixanthobacter luteolus]MXP46699.1 hypothetical protein [Pontixanthobacter luteolus]
MVLSKGDEFPIHQTPEPVAYSGTDRNFYDRYFFNGYAPDGSGFFALAFGVYPHLDVADAHFCVIRDGVQHCIHASRELGMERMDLEVGPIRIEIVEPLSRLRLTVAQTEGIAAEFEFSGRAFPIEEPRFIHRIGPRAFMDYTRMTQNGRYTGSIEVDGDRREIASGSLGTRDRSWGVRPVGARDEQPLPGVSAPTFFWQWTPINLPGGSLFYHLNANPDGTAWNTRAAWVPEGGSVADVTEGQGTLTASLEPGSRWPARGVLELEVPGAPAVVELKAKDRFQMRGLGYTSPDWGHGINHGPLEVAREDINLAELNPLQADNLHVQMICEAKADNGDIGTGIFEQLILGPYGPMGLNEYFDGGS